MRRWTALVAAIVWVAVSPAPCAAQDALDRALPSARIPNETQAPIQPNRPQVDVQADRPQSETSGQQVLVGAITLRGLQALKPADFADIITPRLGQMIDEAGLRALAAAIAQEAQARGYAFATARIEPQRVANGVLAIDVSEGRIDEVRLDGPDEPAVRAALAPLVSGAPVRLDEVECRLLIAGDIDGVHIVS